MEAITWARIIHVLAVVIWIGGVAMVTMVIIPAVKKFRLKEDRITTFERIEGKFSGIAKIATVLTALSGFYMIHEMNAWGRYLDLRFWWIHAMTIVWIIIFAHPVCAGTTPPPPHLQKVRRKRSRKNLQDHAPRPLDFACAKPHHHNWCRSR